jgi:hypothetical protein
MYIAHRALQFGNSSVSCSTHTQHSVQQQHIAVQLFGLVFQLTIILSAAAVVAAIVAVAVMIAVKTVDKVDLK